MEGAHPISNAIDDSRQFYLRDDAGLARLGMFLFILPVVGFAYNDYQFFGFTPEFYALAALRVGLVAYTIAQLIFLTRVKSSASYEKSAFAYTLTLAACISLIDATRPQNFMATTILAIMTVFGFYLVIPNRFTYQMAPSILTVAAQATIIFLGVTAATPIVTVFSIYLSLVLASIVAASSSWQLQKYRSAGFRDMLEHRRAEDALLKSNQLIKTVFASINDAIITYSTAGEVLDFNGAFLKLYRFANKDEVPKNIKGFADVTNMFLADGKPAQEADYASVRALRGETGIQEYKLTRKDTGDTWFANYSFAPMRGEDSQIIGAVMVIHDVTERKMMENELKESYRFLEDRVQERTQTIREQAKLLDETNEAIIVRDLENRITYWNRGAQKTYGWNPEEAIGRKSHELLHSDMALVAEAMSKTISSGQWSGEMKQRTKDGREIIVESRWSPVFDESQKLKSFMVINTDITERKNLEAQYLRAQRLESLGTLAGGVAHDFRNILTPVMIGLDLIDQHLTSREDHEMVEMLQKNLQRGADLSGQLLTFTRGMKGDRTPISVPSLISDVEKTIRETLPKSIHIETKVDHDLLAITADDTQLRQVLINMCINARDAMPSGGTLTITAENVLVDHYYAKLNSEAKEGSYVVISVTDNGVGMPPEVKERLFEPFFTTKKPGEGTGLGLPTARSIVKSHGGFITVYSEEGKGTTFKTYLPTTDTEGGKQEKSEVERFPAGKNQTILIVDDEEPIRIAAKAALENGGYRALEASDGAEALGMYIEHKGSIEVVLLDTAMPIMDGEATIRALKKVNPEVKIIGMSGLAENGRYKAMYNATRAFITKPFTAEKLLSVLAKVLANQ